MENKILFDGDDYLFKKLVEESKIYFEYGCGQSTEYVYKQTQASIFSVDTSKEWVEKIEKLQVDGTPKRLNLNWVDVGEVAKWGTPISFEKRYNFKKYAGYFWMSKEKPDLVLIDGRFRVLCFLTSIKYAPVGTKILFDDYTNRPFYHVAEELCKKLDTCGRQALFEVSETSKSLVNDEQIKLFENVIQ